MFQDTSNPNAESARLTTREWAGGPRYRRPCSVYGSGARWLALARTRSGALVGDDQFAPAQHVTADP
jgi:hypothetical protein